MRELHEGDIPQPDALIDVRQSIRLFDKSIIQRLPPNELIKAYSSDGITSLARTTLGIKTGSAEPVYVKFDLILANRNIMEEAFRRSRGASPIEEIMFEGNEHILRGRNKFISTPLRVYGDASSKVEEDINADPKYNTISEVRACALTLRAQFFTHTERDTDSVSNSLQFGLKIGDSKYYLGSNSQSMPEGPTIMQQLTLGTSEDKLVLFPYQPQIQSEFIATLLSK